MKNKIENKMGLRMITETFGILTRDDMDLVCPLVPPLTFRQPKQNVIGGGFEEITVQKSPCNTGCPLFNMNGSKVEICCGGTKVEYVISKIENPENNQLKITKNDNTIN
jgi:hypothetical protein